MTKSAPSTNVRCVSILLVLLLLLSVVPIQALATTASASGTSDSKEVTYTLTSSFEGGKFKLSSKQSSLFHLYDIIPGDSWKGKIVIKNEATGKMAISLLSITSDIRDLTLFDALYLDISYKGKPIYSGRYNTGISPITDSYVLDKNESLTLDVVVTLPLKTGNEVQNRIMDSTWTFEGQFTEKPQTGENLATENTMNMYVLWILFFALMAAAIVALRIRFVVKAQKKESKEVNRK